MIKVLIKRTFIVLMFISVDTTIAEDIKLIDESSKSDLMQKEIVGCDENSRAAQQNRDLEEIKKQLAFILKKLSELETKEDTKQKSKDISNIKNCLSKLTKEKQDKEQEEKKEEKKEPKKAKPKKDHTIVTVKKGDRLSDYAKKFYGDKRKYYRIYRANRDKIAEDLQLIVGDRIIIPLSPNYKFKKFKKIKHVKKKKVIKKKKIIKDYPMAKIFQEPRKSEVEMLEEPVFIDNEPVDNSSFLPLDDN